MYDGLRQTMRGTYTKKLDLKNEKTVYWDSYAKSWFYKALEQQKKNRIVLIASNNEEDFGLCDSVVTVG
jgi:hypothetical protein